MLYAVRRWGVVPVLLLLGGGLLVTLALLRGGAQLALFVVVPVIFGGSLEFVVGVLLLVIGMFCLPMALEWEVDTDPVASTAPPGSNTGGAGGLVLLGPVPIFLGSWSNVSRRTRLWVALFGAAAFALAVGALVLFRA